MDLPECSSKLNKYREEFSEGLLSEIGRVRGKEKRGHAIARAGGVMEKLGCIDGEKRKIKSLGDIQGRLRKDRTLGKGVKIIATPTVHGS